MVLKTFQIEEPIHITAEPLTPEAFAPYGGVISPDHQTKGHESAANYGTAVKVLKVAPIQNNFHQSKNTNTTATANWNIFRCTPPPAHLIKYGNTTSSYQCKVLERHPFSTQAFVPMGRDRDDIAYLVIVAKTDHTTDKKLPNVQQIKAFVCKGNQSVTYGAGTWHAPMVVLQKVTDFAVLIHENGVPDDDCQECYIDPGVSIEFELNQKLSSHL